jgi:hypothetical protein
LDGGSGSDAHQADRLARAAELVSDNCHQGGKALRIRAKVEFGKGCCYQRT